MRTAVSACPAAVMSTVRTVRATPSTAGGSGSGARCARPPRSVSAASRGSATFCCPAGSSRPRASSHSTGVDAAAARTGTVASRTSPYGGPHTSRSSTARAPSGASASSPARPAGSANSPASARIALTGSCVAVSPASATISCNRAGDIPAVASLADGPSPVAEPAAGDGRQDVPRGPHQPQPLGPAPDEAAVPQLLHGGRQGGGDGAGEVGGKGVPEEDRAALRATVRAVLGVGILAVPGAWLPAGGVPVAPGDHGCRARVGGGARPSAARGRARPPGARGRGRPRALRPPLHRAGPGVRHPRHQGAQRPVPAAVGGHGQRLGHLAGERRQVVERAQHRRAGRRAGGELGQVVGHRREQVGAGPQQARQRLVVACAQVLREGARLSRLHPSHISRTG